MSNAHRLAALVLALAALPALANEGGGDKGGGERSQQKQPATEAASPAAADPASAAARDFYVSVVAGIDAAIEAKRAEIAEWDKEIAAIDHPIARDFAAERTGDKTVDDMKESAEKALDSRRNKRAAEVAAAGYLDPGASDATIMIIEFESTVEELRSLEAARADMAEAARGFGATID
jgi:hypothetical protein